MDRLPTGTVTFLFTDIEGSTRLWERHPLQMEAALVRHNELLTTAITRAGGRVFKTVGDAFCAAFATAPAAVVAAIEAQRALHAEDWGEIGTLRVRMAVHAGAVEERGADYFGPPLNRVARLLAIAHGGQALLSLAARALVSDSLPEGVTLRDLGEHALKDIKRMERVAQLVAPGLPDRFPPLRSAAATPANTPAERTNFAITGTDAAGTRILRELVQGDWTIGRAATCEIVLNDVEVSRTHAMLRVASDEVRVEDLGSRNGTFVQGQRVTSAQVNPGDRVSLGRSVLYLLAPGLEQTMLPGDEAPAAAGGAQ